MAKKLKSMYEQEAYSHSLEKFTTTKKRDESLQRKKDLQEIEGLISLF